LQGVYHSRELSRAIVSQLKQDAAAYLRRPLQSSAEEGTDSFVTWSRYLQAYGPSCADPDRSKWQQVPLCLEAETPGPAVRP
jgi:hypothetical protein